APPQFHSFPTRRSSDLGGFVRRSAFALAFLDYNLLASGAIDGDSQMLWRRSVNERVRQLAPFLEFDGDPYPVVVDGGVQWVIDRSEEHTSELQSRENLV